MKIEKGQKAPGFSLYDTEKNLVKLEDFQGKKLVLLFFPAAFTGVCTKELCGIRDEFSWYQTLHAQVLGISVDALFTLGKFKELNNLAFPLLSDFNKETATAYGALYAEWSFGMKGVAKRSAFVIDSSGTVQYAEVLESAGDLPDFTAIKNCLQQIS